MARYPESYVEDYNSELSEAVPLTRRQITKRPSGLSKLISADTSSYEAISSYEEGASVLDPGYSSHVEASTLVDIPPPYKVATPGPPSGTKTRPNRLLSPPFRRPSSDPFSHTQSPAVPWNIPRSYNTIRRELRENSTITSTLGSEDCDCPDCSKASSKPVTNSPNRNSGAWPLPYAAYQYRTKYDNYSEGAPAHVPYTEPSWEGGSSRRERSSIQYSMPPPPPPPPPPPRRPIPIPTFTGPSTTTSSHTLSGLWSQPSYIPGYGHTPSPAPALPTPASTCPPSYDSKPETGFHDERLGVPYIQSYGRPHLLSFPPPLPSAPLVVGIKTQPNQGSMAASMKNFDGYKLETEFHDGYVVHNMPKREYSTRLWEKSTWEQKEKIGSGNFGNVWLQKNREGGQLRAVKILLRDSLPRAGFSQELLALVKVKDHDRYFVKFFGWYDNSDYIYFAMEYIEHGDLHEYMLKDPQKAKADAKEVTRQILMGLEILHKKEICHRDLKPPNILIASPSPIWVKIADFGVAKRTINTTARTGWGTEGYRAPELLGALPRKLSTKKFPIALDIWSLGSLVYKLLTSQTPFADTDEEDLAPETGVVVEWDCRTDLNSLVNYCHGSIEFPIGILQKSLVSDEGIAFVKSLLTPNPKDRPTASSVLQDPWLKEP